MFLNKSYGTIHKIAFYCFPLYNERNQLCVGTNQELPERENSMPRFEAPIGPEDERNAGIIWPTEWEDANDYLSRYDVKPGRPAIHTGADLNLIRGIDFNKEVYAMGAGTVTFAGHYSDTAWGGLIVIYHGVVDFSDKGVPVQKMVYSRYGHVQGIEPSILNKKGVTVTKGQIIARIGTGGPKLNFDPHLHFDISTTNKLDKDPGYWPGMDKAGVEEHFVDPYKWLIERIEDNPASKPAATENNNTELRYVSHPDGVKVYKDHNASEVPAMELKQGAQLRLISGAGKYWFDGVLVWAQISGGDFDGNWAPVGKKDNTLIYLSRKPPA